MIESSGTVVGLSECHQALQETFDLHAFRPGQQEAITALLAGKDVMVVMPTGGGKSLIYQLPAAVQSSGLTLVISPLIALMKDQTDALRAMGVAAEFCNSSQDELEQMRVISHAVTGKIRLLYVSPERAVSSDFLAMLPRMPVTMIAVDEAHCISQWGHDFRPDYRELHKLRARLLPRRVPVVALTATATSQVKGDIRRSLELENCQVIEQSFLRANLSYSIEYSSGDVQKHKRLLELLEEGNFRRIQSGRCIVYCATRTKVESVYAMLHSKGFRVGRYHAGRSPVARQKAQASYANGKVNVLVATNAFGMGMDQPNVRTVIHYQIPSSIEAYYQESGRAGRDGQAARCILFFSKADFVTQNLILAHGKRGSEPSALLEKVEAYGYAQQCRQVFLCQYFGETVAPCGHCDHCAPAEADKQKRFLEEEVEKKQAAERRSRHDFLDEEVAAMEGVLKEYPGKFGKKILTGILRGSKSRDILNYKLNLSDYYGRLRHVTDEAIGRFFSEGLQSESILVSGKKYPKLYLSSHPPRKTPQKTAGSKKGAGQRKKSPESALLSELRSFRDREARRLKWKKYMVLQNGVLSRIAKQRPASLRELGTIKGFGSAKAEKFGREILRIVGSQPTN